MHSIAMTQQLRQGIGKVTLMWTCERSPAEMTMFRFAFGDFDAEADDAVDGSDVT
jgi:hypothetical protein